METSRKNPVYYAANIDWNVNDWRGVAPDRLRSGFGYVRDGGTPCESWNLDFSNARNSPRSIYGYVKNAEKAKEDRATIILTSKSPQEERFVVGVYGYADILRERPSEWSSQSNQDGSTEYANLSVPREFAVACAHSRLFPWDIERHYGKSYGNGRRQWPGRASYLVLNEEHAQILLKDLVFAHRRWNMQNPSDTSRATRLIGVVQKLLGDNSSKTSEVDAPGPKIPDSDVVLAVRQRVESERLLRNAPQLRALKEAYGYTCQVDRGHRLELPGAEPYVEVHHIKPIALGGILADETFSNCLVLCPSCHVLFQSGALWIDSLDGHTIRHFRKDVRYERKKVRLLPGHQIDQNVLSEIERSMSS